MKMKMFTSMRMLIGMALISGFSTTSYAEFNLDKLKAIADKAKTYQEKLKREQQVSSPMQNEGTVDRIENSPSSGKLSEISLANPDVIGLTLGITGLKEARQVFIKYEPKLNVLEDTVLGGSQPYIGVLRGYAENCGYMCYRHELFAKLAAPEAGGRVITVSRRLQFTSDATSLPNMLDALRKKYGGDNYVKKIPPSQLLSFWAWSSDGRPIALSADHPCAETNVAPRLWANAANRARAEEYAKPALKAGCAAIVFGNLMVQNDMVTSVVLQAVDVVGIVRSGRIAAEAQAAAANRQKQIQREKAEQQHAPPL